MNKRFLGWGACLAMLLSIVATPARADVKMDEKSQIKFGGMLGKMMGLFGGKVAKEGLVTTVSVQGDRRMRLTEAEGELIDLNEEKIYDLDLRKKTYKVTTFVERRRQLEEARRQAEKQAARQRGDEVAKEWEFDVKLKETGQSKTINGFSCREVVTTITVREKGKTLEQGGGMVLTSNLWLTAEIAAAKEVAAFNQRYFEKLEGLGGARQAAEQMAQAFAFYPGLREALAKMETENVNMKGTPILTSMSVQSVPSKEQIARQQEKQGDESSEKPGGLFGGLSRRLGRKKSDDQGGSQQPQTPDSIFTMNHEVLKIATTDVAADVSVPADFKQKN